MRGDGRIGLEMNRWSLCNDQSGKEKKYGDIGMLRGRDLIGSLYRLKNFR